MPEFHNEFELHAGLMGILNEIVDAVAQKVIDKLKENIDEYVYVGGRQYYYVGLG